jgi:xylulokinase
VDKYLIGIDLGTSGSKCILIDEAGNLKGKAITEYPTLMPRPSWTEQDPEAWWRATVRSVRATINQSNVDPKQIAGIGLTGQMHGLVVLDSTGQVLRPCILWNDQRTVDQCRQIEEKIGIEHVLKLTGNLVLTGFTAPKLLWVRQNEPQTYAKVAKILLPKDYIRYRLSGEFYSEVSDASGTSLFDVLKREWSQEMLDALEIPMHWLPEVSESPVCTTRVSKKAAEETGLIPGTPIAGGGGDQAAQALGMGIIEEGIISTTIGTSGVVFAASNSYRIEPNGLLHSFCHVIPGMWHLMGVMLSAGGSLRWFRDTFGKEEIELSKEFNQDPYTLLIAQAQEIAAGSEGLIFLPYLSGERTPYNNPFARGVFFGISNRHQKGHFVRAILEGVAFGLLDSLLLIKQLGIDSKEIVLSGGGARSEVWQRILTDVFDMPTVTTNSEEGAAFGAALLAGLGTKIFESPPDAVSRTIKSQRRMIPGENQRIYREIYPLFKSLYSSIVTEYNQMYSLVERIIR